MNRKQLISLLKLCKEYNIKRISIEDISIVFQTVSQDKEPQSIPPLRPQAKEEPEEAIPPDLRRKELELLLHSDISDPAEIDALL